MGTIHNATNTSYSPVLILPDGYAVFDLSEEDAVAGMHGQEWGLGKYNEKRRRVYKGFYHGDRDIHMGVDLFGPAGTEVHVFANGEIFMIAVNEKPGDYGPTIICKHYLHDGSEVYALYGHLSTASLDGKTPGQPVKAGEVIAWTGQTEENGGWPSHVHFQLCREAPAVCDIPGVVSAEQLEVALQLYPDPRTVLGPIF